jgi:hypothetical protein
MAISTEEFARHYPRLYHMAEAGTWPSIKRFGLLSTSALLDLYEIKGEQRRQIESCRRPESVKISHPKYRPAIIRDQKPMNDQALAKCLREMTPREWYELLNRKTFFWVTAERVNGLLVARAYRGREHTVLTIDTAKLLSQYHAKVTLSAINSGSTLYNPQPRGKDTFLKLNDYPFKERKKMRGIANAVAEFAVDHGLHDIKNYVVRVERRKGVKVLEVIHRS